MEETLNVTAVYGQEYKEPENTPAITEAEAAEILKEAFRKE